MTWDKAVTDLVRRYLFAVEQDLPRRLRSDVTKELRTLIEDKLEDRAERLGQPVDTALAGYVLQEIGKPGEVARRYDPAPQYLVGPRFYPAFMKIARIGLVGLAVMVLFTTVLGHISSTTGQASLVTLGTLWHLITLYFQLAVTLFGEAVIILAILERTLPGRAAARAREWNPHDLPEAPESELDKVSVIGSVVDVCLTLLVLILLNVFPQWVGVIMVTDGKPSLVPLTDFGLRLPLLAINLWLALAVALKLLVLTQRRWSAVTRWAQVGLGLFGAVIVFQIVARTTLHAPPGVPGFEHALRPLAWLLTISPLFALFAPLTHVVQLIRGHLDPAAVRE
jgi:hypothetical protein